MPFRRARAWSHQPELPVIDWNDPINKKLEFWIPFTTAGQNGGNTVRELTGRVVVGGNGSYRVPDMPMIGHCYRSVRDFYTVTPKKAPVITGTFTIAGRFRTIDPDGDHPWVFTTRPGGFASFDWQCTMTANVMSFHSDIGEGAVWLTTSADVTGLATPTGRWHGAAYVVTPTGWSCYFNGVRVGGGAFSGTPMLWDMPGGYFPEIGGLCWGNLDWRCWSRALSPAELARFMLTPPNTAGALMPRLMRLPAGVASGSAYSNTVAETLAPSDAPTGIAGFKGTQAETMAGADVPAGLASLKNTLADTQAATDAPTAVRAFVTAVGETLAASDAGSALAALQGTLSEAVAATETATALQGFLAALTESAGSLETVQAAAGYLAALADSLGALDTVFVPGNSFSAALSESLAAGDVATATQTLVAALSETAAVSDTAQTVATLLASFTDSLTLSDLFSGAGHDYVTSVTDTLSVTDAALAASALAGVILEAASVTDLYTARAALRSLFADDALPADQFASRAAWKALLVEAMATHDELVRPAYRKRYGPGRGGSGDVAGAGARPPSAGATGRAEDGDAVDRINDGGARPR